MEVLIPGFHDNQITAEKTPPFLCWIPSSQSITQQIANTPKDKMGLTLILLFQTRNNIRSYTVHIFDLYHFLFSMLLVALAPSLRSSSRYRILFPSFPHIHKLFIYPFQAYPHIFQSLLLVLHTMTVRPTIPPTFPTTRTFRTISLSNEGLDSTLLERMFLSIYAECGSPKKVSDQD